MSEPNICETCNEEVGMMPSEMCGYEEVGDTCRCCGRTLLAKAEDNE